MHEQPNKDYDAKDWRAEALNEALTFEARRGKGEEQLRRLLREQRPESTIISLYPERLHLFRHLRDHYADFRALVPGTAEYESSSEQELFWPYLGWYAFSWEGDEYELIFVPDYNANSEHILLGGDSAKTRRLADELIRATDGPIGRCLRYAEGWESAPDMDREVGRITWDDLVLPEATLKGMREAVEGWARSRDAYAALGFAWRRGILLVGPPGTGKTMICKAAAAALPQMPFLYVRDLREDDKKEAIQAIFKRARRLAPCVLALEDIDTLITAENRSIFLNELDGFSSNEGILVLASSNHPHKIDEAFLKRPSRFDRVFHIGLPKASERAEFCRRVLTRTQIGERLAEGFDVERLAQSIAERTENFTPAYLKEALVAGALSLAQSNEDGTPMVLDERYAEAVLAQVEELKQTLRRLKDPAVLSEMTAGEGTIGLRRV